jgi:hypothetical protein
MLKLFKHAVLFLEPKLSTFFTSSLLDYSDCVLPRNFNQSSFESSAKQAPVNESFQTEHSQCFTSAQQVPITNRSQNITRSTKKS